MEYMEFIERGKHNEYDICACVDFMTRMCKSIECTQCPLWLSSLVTNECQIKYWQITDDRIKLKKPIEKMNQPSYMDKVYDVLDLCIGDKIKVNGDTYRVGKKGLVSISNNEADKDLLSDILTGQAKFQRMT